MDELPELLVEAVGDAPVIETVDIGGGDAVVTTTEATHLYRSEGLLSDESVETFEHDATRLDVSVGRRKATVTLTDVAGEHSFTVPSKMAEAIVEGVLEGVLRTTNVVAPDETVESVFRFSELTLVVTDEQLIKHIGSAVWDDEFESARFADLTGLDFEDGSVATQVVVETNDRPQRVKVPNEHAGRVREEIQRSVFEFHGVSSLGGLRAAVAPPEPESNEEATEPEADDDGADDGFVSHEWSPPADQDVTGPRGRVRSRDTGDGASTRTIESGDDAETSAAAHASSDIEALNARLDRLTETVERQTELLEAQQTTIEQLVDELRRGR